LTFIPESNILPFMIESDRGEQAGKVDYLSKIKDYIEQTKKDKHRLVCGVLYDMSHEIFTKAWLDEARQQIPEWLNSKDPVLIERKKSDLREAEMETILARNIVYRSSILSPEYAKTEADLSFYVQNLKMENDKKFADSGIKTSAAVTADALQNLARHYSK
jgi:hypothetical protein